MKSIIPFWSRGKKTSLKCTYPGDAEEQTHSSSAQKMHQLNALEKGMVFLGGCKTARRV